MKNALLFLSLSAFCLTATAQGYRPLLQEGSYWIMHTTFCDAGSIERIEVDGDTTIANTAYKILRSRYCNEPDRLHGFARTNTTNSKLWFRDIFGQEALIMDLDLEAGAIFTGLEGGSEPFIGLVERVDTVDGRKVITFHSDYLGWCLIGSETEPLRFIEGVGPNSGLFARLDYLLDCMGVGEENVFQFDAVPWWYSYCDLECYIEFSDIEAEPTLSPIELIITPTAITLQSNTSEQYLLRIFAPLGPLLQTHRISAGTTVPLQNLPAGWYAIGLYEQTGNLVLGRKIVVL